MKFIWIEEGYDPRDFSSGIMTEELALMGFDRTLSWELKLRHLKALAQTTSEAAFLCSEEDFHPSLLSPLKDLGLRHFCLELEVGENTWEAGPEILRVMSPERRFKGLERFKEIQAQTGDAFRLSVLLTLRPAPLKDLATVLTFFMANGVDMIFLDPFHLNLDQHLSSLEAAFRHLEIFSPLPSLIFFIDRDKWGLDHPLSDLVLNPFAGPKIVDIDVANTCTHNCIFCGFYSPKIPAKERPEEWMTKVQIDKAKCFELLREIPSTVDLVQFGGLGDPFTHKSILEFLTKARRRGFAVKVLTNFAYMNEKLIRELHHLGGDDRESLEFIVNFSGATPETYLKTRPNQTHKSFDKICADIKLATDLFNREGKGIFITLMFVANNLNFHEMPDFVNFAQKLGVKSVWLKPMEIHFQHNLEFLVPEEKQNAYREGLREAIRLADQWGISIFKREEAETVVAREEEEEREKREEEGYATQVQNGWGPRDHFSRFPCRIGYHYLRIPVDLKVLPCCIIGKPLGDLKNRTWKEVWHSGAYAHFRHKMNQIHLEKFHIKDPEWSFCQQCPHRELQEHYGASIRTSHLPPPPAPPPPETGKNPSLPSPLWQEKHPPTLPERGPESLLS